MVGGETAAGRTESDRDVRPDGARHRLAESQRHLLELRLSLGLRIAGYGRRRGRDRRRALARHRRGLVPIGTNLSRAPDTAGSRERSLPQLAESPELRPVLAEVAAVR